MSSPKISLFAQVLNLIDWSAFRSIVRKHNSDKYNKGITSRTHLVSMLFMQMAGATSLRDMSNGLRSATVNLNHLGVQRAACKSSLSYINKVRNYEVFMDLYFAMLDRLEPSLLHRKRLYASRLKRKVFKSTWADNLVRFQ